MGSLFSGDNALTPWINETVKFYLECRVGVVDQEIVTRLRRPKMAQIINVYAGDIGEQQQKQQINVTPKNHGRPTFIEVSDGKYFIGALLSANALSALEKRGLNHINFSNVVLEKWVIKSVICVSGVHRPFLEKEIGRLCLCVDEVRILSGGANGKSGEPKGIHTDGEVRDKLKDFNNDAMLKKQMELAYNILIKSNDVETNTKQVLPMTSPESRLLDPRETLLGAAKVFLGKESSQSSSSSSEVMLSTQRSNTIQEYSQDQHTPPVDNSLTDVVGISEMITSTESNDISSSGTPMFKAVLAQQESQMLSHEQLTGSDQENVNNAKLTGFGLSQYESSQESDKTNPVTDIPINDETQNKAILTPQINPLDTALQEKLTQSSRSTSSKRTIDQISSQEQESVDLLAGYQQRHQSNASSTIKYATIKAAKQKPLWDPKCADFKQASKGRKKDDDGLYVNNIMQDDGISKMKIEKYGIDLTLWLRFHVSHNSGRTKKKFGVKVKKVKHPDIGTWLEENTI